MCGIVGYVGSRPAVNVLIGGLRRLEYRGYDSTGVAFFRPETGATIEVLKSEGKLENVENLIKASAAKYESATCGIGHTRWATHGKPTTTNAHPHRAGHIVLVHNGIIENYQEIKKDLISRGHLPQSETDSELFGFLALEEMNAGLGLVEAVRKAFMKLEGQCSVVVISEREPGVVVGVRNGSPLVAARDPRGGAIIASDAQPLLEYTKDVYFLENGDVAIADAGGLRFVGLADGQPLARSSAHLDWSVEKLDKGGFPHYMLKEIHEQPATVVDTLNAMFDREHSVSFKLAEHPGARILEKAREITIVACGTSWHAALVGKYWLERWAQIPVNVDLASEFRYRDPVLGQGAVIIGVTQSGETADTMAVIRDARARGIPTIGVTNVRGSTISREADAVFYTAAGPEIGVAATKTFTAQLLMMLSFAGALAKMRGRPGLDQLFADLVKLPHMLSDALDPTGDLSAAVRNAAFAVKDAKGFFFIGRGTSFPIALEGALKLKEIAYVHAEGYAAGELKHGPIAMIEKQMVVVVLAPKDLWRDKTVSNLEEVKARGAIVIGVGDASDASLRSLCDHWIPVTSPASKGVHESLLPFLLTPVVQLLSYEIAVIKGTDVDKPRNLAKSVTVE